MRRSPFTLLCKQAAVLRRPIAADLHTHTTASDGEYTPSQLVALARRAQLDAIAITDHDTTAGLAEATETARQFTVNPIEVIPGVEVTTDLAGREVHVLGLFVRPEHPELSAQLAETQRRRRGRFFALADAIGRDGVALDRGELERTAARVPSLGRRHLATLLVAGGVVKTRNEAFRRVLLPLTPTVPPLHRVPFADAVRVIAAAGGVSCIAHPPAELTRDDLAALAAVGLNGVEAVFPAGGVGRANELRGWAADLGLAVCGGSDCHGPDPAARAPGSFGVSAADLDRLRQSADRSR